MNSVNVTLSHEQNRTLASFDGELTIYAMESLSPVLTELVSCGGLLTVDLSTVTDMDGSGFQFLLIIKHHRDLHSDRTEIIAGEAVLKKLGGLGLAEIFSELEEVAYGT